VLIEDIFEGRSRSLSPLIRPARLAPIVHPRTDFEVGLLFDLDSARRGYLTVEPSRRLPPPWTIDEREESFTRLFSISRMNPRAARQLGY
jgi:hypothetical protein